MVSGSGAEPNRRGLYNGVANRGLIDPSVYDKIFKELDGDSSSGTITITIKEPGPKQSKPGNWKENEVAGEPPKNAPPRETSPLVNPIEARIAAAFPSGRPSLDTLDTIQCKHCKKPILRHTAPAHIKRCLSKKAAKSQRKKEAKEAKDAAARRAQGIISDEEVVKADTTKPGAKKSAIKELEGDSKKGKKRKAEEASAEKAPKKKKKDEPKAKTKKEKAPVDVETQCGVVLANGAKCARSLTCKSHSMGAKRAVPGRSAKYDVLLAAYQRKNQARQQRAFIDANAPVEDDEDQGNIDSDEEKDAFMAAIARARPRPLATHTVMDKKEQYKYLRMKEVLRAALEGSRARGLFDVAPRDDGPRTAMFWPPDSAGGFGFPGGPESVHDASSRRSSVAPSVRHGQIASRKGSIAGIPA